ncbi:helix-turn-helix transcriptional regulator [Streptomyces sp. Z423-1]|uniref:response regulator transcription factor n=1 Tax=unclassified Streptomyces TaxID=2593676 RepID=UPI001487EC35|nr:helix-turn-helix transcriptional regulator [Streptomyces sp. Z423-1]
MTAVHRATVRRPAQPRAAVTSRQLQILALAASGYTAAQTAARLGIQPSTVHERLHRVYRKLGARDRAHAVAIALVTGLLDPVSVELPPGERLSARLTASEGASGAPVGRSAAGPSRRRTEAAA